ncbi:MAG: hypothetical protein IT573_02670 [Deltaproteobacteria bacterium]|nr:hypothetical protein [Deltaproteobacteria bacterium]
MRINARHLAIFLALGLTLAPSAARPCGLCHEDDRSAVYSYEAVQKVKADPARLEFAVFKVVGPLPKATLDRLTQWLGARPGVDAATIKISATQKSMGFVWERSGSKPALIADLAKAFPELKVHALVYDDPK